ncbi:MAG TPA: SDR family NAD(P)-dependent oxidoreductase [Candidatus Binatia bacterium]|jgi:NAD(P)-dependent dehydrogenase (short-subunit alcohol dehydrogenase family)
MSGCTAVVSGVGPARGLGAAIARRFAREGFRVVVIGRSSEKLATAVAEIRAAGGVVHEVVGDVTDEELVRSAIAAADAAEAPLEVAVFNAGGNWPMGFLAMDREFLEGMWRTGALGGFFFAKAALERMLPRGRGTLLLTGASASLRGRANFGGFAQAKAALRALAQSAAREFGPQGIHVGHVIVDGMIDGDRVNTFLPHAKAEKGADGMLDPDAIADSFWMLHCQQRSAWTHEIDVRPWTESW